MVFQWLRQRKTKRVYSYHVELGPGYLFPRDAIEHDRLNYQHHFLRYILKGNYLAPIPETIESILDVGAGTGI